MQSRRDILRTGGTLAATGLSTALAGCADVPLVGSYFDDDFDYREWVYDPSVLGGGSTSVTALDVAGIRASTDAFETAVIGDDEFEAYGDEITAAAVDHSLSVGTVDVLTGSFDATVAAEEITATDGEGHDGFDVYETDDDDPGLVATDGDVLIDARGSGDLREDLEQVLETGAGDADRFGEVDDDVARVEDELGTADVVSYSAWTDAMTEDAPDDAVVADGVATQIHGEDARGSAVRVFNHEDGVDAEAVEAEYEAQEDVGASIDDVSTDGRVVVVEYTVPTEIV